jgi:hypothetical protein
MLRFSLNNKDAILRVSVIGGFKNYAPMSGDLMEKLKLHCKII